MSAPHLPSSDRFDQIDALRAIAALLVLLPHSVQLIAPKLALAARSDLAERLFDTFHPSRMGVVLFFVISGYVIPSSLRGPRASAGRAFVIRRFFRLFPAYWLSIPVGLLALYVLYGHTLSLATVAANVTMIPEALGYDSVLGVYWTLQTELAFYAICLLLHLRGVVQRPAAFAWMLLIAAAGEWAWTQTILMAARAPPLPAEELGAAYRVAQVLVGDPGAAWNGLNSMFCAHLSVMALGALLRMWHDGRPLGWFAGACLVAAIGYWTLWYWPKPVLYGLTGKWSWDAARMCVPYSAAVAIFLLMARASWFSSRPLVHMGEVSYSLYLFHWPVIGALAVLIERSQIAMLTDVPILFYMALATAASTAAAAAIYAGIEKPAMRFGRVVAEGRLFRRAAT